MNPNQTVLEKEIELIQSCISRMAQNSFVIKGWTVALVAVVLALLPDKVDIRLLCILGIIITICFWYLDAFFLRAELLYRWKYEWIIANRLKSKEGSYDLNPYNKKMWLAGENGVPRKAPIIIRVMVTKTLTPIYVPLLILSIFFLTVECAKNRI